MTDTPNSSPVLQKEPEEPFVLTPEILAYENRRNDLIIAAGVLLFAFFLGSFRDNHPDVPLRLATGRLIAESGIPKHDAFTYGAPADKAWINPSWLFDRMLFGVWDTVGDAAAGVLKALGAAVVVLPLLFIRHPGPTLWWTAFCAFLAAAGMAPRIYLGSEILSLAFASATLLMWHFSKTTGRSWLLWIAVPLSILWANLDPSVFVGALILLALGIGEIVQSFLARSLTFGDRQPTVAGGVQTIVAAVLVFFASAATPYGQGTLLFPYEWFAHVLPQASHAERDFFGWNGILSATREGADESSFFNRMLDAKLSYAETAWVFLIVAAAASFFLNFNRFSASRLLLALVAVGLPVLASRYIGPSAILLASILSLNGQEAFLDAFGPDARVTRGWVLWSQAGRMVSIVALFIALIVAPTGRIVPTTIGLFGFGFAANTFPDPASCRWLEEAGFQGRSFIPSAVRLPSMLAWEAPEVKYFIDSRWQLFADPPSGGGPSPLESYTTVQKTLLEDTQLDDKLWKPFFAKHNVTHLVFDPWRPININALRCWYPDVRTLLIKDRIAVVGNGGLPNDHLDRKTVDKLRVRANDLVFNPPPRSKDDPPPQIQDARMVGAPTIIDWLWRHRYSTPSGVVAAGLMSQDVLRLDMPGALFLALLEARKGISEQPDNPLARVRLGAVYEQIYVREALTADVGLSKRFQIEQKRLKEAEKRAKKGAAEEKAPRKEDQAAKKEPAGKADEKAAKKDDAAAGKDAKAKDEDLPVAHGMLRPRESKWFIPLRHFQMMCAYREAVRAFTPEGFNKYLFSEDPPLPTKELVAMGQRAGTNGYIDATVEIFKLAQRKAVDPEDRDFLQREIARLEQQMEEASAKIEQRVADVQKQALEQSAPTELLYQRMQFYRSNGMPLKSLQLFEEAAPNNPEIEAARISATEIYLELGFAEKAQEQLNLMPPGALRRAGDLQYLNAQVLLAAGQYDGAKTQLEQSLADIRTARVRKGLDTLDMILRGAPLLATGQEGPVGPLVSREEVVTEITREARLSFELGLLLLEMGKPKDAMKAFVESLETFPRTPLRPIMDYYASFVPGTKLPPEAPVYIGEDELSVRFDTPPEAPKKEESRKPDAPKKK